MFLNYRTDESTFNDDLDFMEFFPNNFNNLYKNVSWQSEATEFDYGLANFVDIGS